MTSGAETILTVLNGPSKGTVYRLVSGRVSLGRGPDNDIIIVDPKCSRNHAEIIFTNSGIEIHDITDRNMIQVDGRECKSAVLKDNSVIQLGHTELRLSFKSAGALAPRDRSHIQSPGYPPAMMSGGAAAPFPHQGYSQPHLRRAKPKSNSFRWVAIGAIGLILWMGLSGNNSDNKPKVSDQQIEAETKAVQTVLERARRRPKDVSVNDVGYNKAQESFVVGFRDYRKGQFERAMSSFQACLSLYPQHVLCTRYLRLSQRKFDELIQYHMVLGKKYRDQNQYGACASAFKNVMFMVKDSTNKRYQEAKANLEACSAQLEERF